MDSRSGHARRGPPGVGPHWALLQRIEKRQVTVGRGALVLRLSRGQVQRLRQAVRVHRSRGVVHGNRGRPPPNRLAEVVRERVIGLRRGKYDGFNDQHFTEKLNEVE